MLEYNAFKVFAADLENFDKRGDAVVELVAAVIIVLLHENEADRRAPKKGRRRICLSQPAPRSVANWSGR